MIVMASNEQQQEQQWAIASRAKQQIRQNKRRERVQCIQVTLSDRTLPFLIRYKLDH